MIDTLGQSLEAETHKVLMVTDSEAPNFDTHDFRADIAAEVTGTGYTLGGVDDHHDRGHPRRRGADLRRRRRVLGVVTIANAMAAVGYTNVGSAATDQLIWLSDFVTAAVQLVAGRSRYNGPGRAYLPSITPLEPFEILSRLDSVGVTCRTRSSSPTAPSPRRPTPP